MIIIKIKISNIISNFQLESRIFLSIKNMISNTRGLETFYLFEEQMSLNNKSKNKTAFKTAFALTVYLSEKNNKV